MYRQKLKPLHAAGERQRARRELQDRLAAVSAGPRFARGPGANAADYFCRSFEQLGRARAERQAPQSAGEKTEPRSAAEDAGATGAEDACASGERIAPARSKGIPSKPLPLRRFSELAFRRGNLAGSILRGTGKMMLVSCLRRTVNPRRPEPHETLRPGVKRLPFSGHDPDTQVFMRDLARGAVSVVVDTLHDAHRTMQLLQEAVERGGPGAEELFSMYPFLDDRGERELLAEYRAALSSAADADTRAMLQNAIVHAEASAAEKAKMRMDFLTALRSITERARQAIEEFESEDIAGEAARQAAEEEELPEEPPPPEDPRKPKREGRSEEAPAPPERGEHTEETDAPPEKPRRPERGGGREETGQARGKERRKRGGSPERMEPPPENSRAHEEKGRTGEEAGAWPGGEGPAKRERPVPERNAGKEAESGVYAAGPEPPGGFRAKPYARHAAADAPANAAAEPPAAAPVFEGIRGAAFAAAEPAAEAGRGSRLLLGLALLGALGAEKAMERNARAAKHAEDAKNAAIREAFNRSGGDAGTAMLSASLRQGASLRGNVH